LPSALAQAGVPRELVDTCRSKDDLEALATKHKVVWPGAKQPAPAPAASRAASSPRQQQPKKNRTPVAQPVPSKRSSSPHKNKTPVAQPVPSKRSSSSPKKNKAPVAQAYVEPNAAPPPSRAGQQHCASPRPLVCHCLGTGASYKETVPGRQRHTRRAAPPTDAGIQISLPQHNKRFKSGLPMQIRFHSFCCW
jgi:hypothetical protein